MPDNAVTWGQVQFLLGEVRKSVGDVVDSHLREMRGVMDERNKHQGERIEHLIRELTELKTRREVERKELVQRLDALEDRIDDRTRQEDSLKSQFLGGWTVAKALFGGALFLLGMFGGKLLDKLWP